MKVFHRLAVSAAAACFSLGAMAVSAGQAAAGVFDSGIPSGWSCVGTCGASPADGVVTAPPSGATNYGWVSSNQGVSGVGLGLGGERTGSVLRTVAFTAEAGDELAFSFNYVTSDGAGFSDYAWARLLNSALVPVSLLFTARTTPGGSTVPGFGMPPIEATIDPATVTIVAGPPVWSPLGGSSGTCYAAGCGFTGWVQSTYSILAGGTYYLEFGVVNVLDSAYQSGLAFDGITVGGVIIGPQPIPEPMTLSLLGAGLIGLAAVRRSRREDKAAAAA
ncbi:NF038132 family protein [Caenispirillum bisanense]|uniref:NF038132 family protein n=1 Tax=Caenispirillum bisanense TaxID=414052 RepID=UPI0031D198A1